jgi:site-specific DNA-methyltransferase (adenine-specific)
MGRARGGDALSGIVREVTIGNCRLIQGDCLEVMPGLGSVDMVCTDPPYGTTACKWDSVIPFAPMWGQMKRVVKPSGAIVLMASQPFTSALVMSNVAMFKYCWVWEKSRPTGHVQAKNKPMKAHEDITVFSTGTTVHASQSATRMSYNPQGLQSVNILKKQDTPGRRASGAGSTVSTRPSTKATHIQTQTNYPRSIVKISSESLNAHPTQKPVALMEYLIRTYTNPGETVLDFTMGSGTTGVAAANTGRRFVGIERDLGYFDVAVKRTREAVEQASAPVQGGMGF